MHSIMVIEIIVIAIALLAGLVITLVLRKKLKDYDGMGEVKKGKIGKNKPPKKVL